MPDVATALPEPSKKPQTTTVPVYILAGIIVCGFFGLMIVMMLREVPSANVGPVNQLFGSLATSFGTVVGYFFGSSAASRAKDETLAAVVKSQGGAP